MDHFVYEDDSEVWLRDIMANHHDAACRRVTEILNRTREDENGCWVCATQRRPKTRFRGRQVSAARFVYCVANREILSERVVIRHRCHNARCVNPRHLRSGSAGDNKRDDWDYWANGVNYDLL